MTALTNDAGEVFRLGLLLFVAVRKTPRHVCIVKLPDRPVNGFSRRVRLSTSWARRARPA